MKEIEIEKEFKKYKNKLIKELGRHALDNDEINNISRHLFKSKYKGSFAQDEKFPLKKGYYIINTDTKEGDGIHWTALILTGKTAFMYDSFVRDPKVILPHLVKRLSKFKIKYDTKDAEQRATYKNKVVITCGHNSIAWLMIADKYGVKNAIKV